MMKPPSDDSDNGVRTSEDVTASFYAGARAMRATLSPWNQTTWPEGWGPDPGPLDLGAPSELPRPATFADGDRVQVGSWANGAGTITGWRGDFGEWWVQMDSQKYPFPHAFKESYLTALRTTSALRDSDAK